MRITKKSCVTYPTSRIWWINMKTTIDILKVILYGALIGTLININIIMTEPFRLAVVGTVFHVMPPQQNNKNNYDKFNHQSPSNRKGSNI